MQSLCKIKGCGPGKVSLIIIHFIVIGSLDFVRFDYTIGPAKKMQFNRHKCSKEHYLNQYQLVKRLKAQQF